MAILAAIKGQRDTKSTGPSLDGPAPRQPYIGFLAPPAIYSLVVQMGADKAKQAWYKTFWLAVLAGVYLSFGGMLAYSVGGQMPQLQQSNPGAQKLLFGAFGLPFGLAMIVICGGELLTSNFAFMPAAFYEGKCSIVHVAVNWFLSFWGNLAGSLLFMWFIDESHILYPNSATSTYPVSISRMKAHEGGWGVPVMRGILCNWLVVLGIWQATAAQDIIGKIFGIWFPIMAFVASTYDHVVANMFLIPMGIKLNSMVSVGSFIVDNLLPVLLGNMISGTFFVAFSYAVCFGTVVERIKYWVGLTKMQPPCMEEDGIYNDDTAHAGRRNSNVEKNSASSMV